MQFCAVGLCLLEEGFVRINLYVELVLVGFIRICFIEA